MTEPVAPPVSLKPLLDLQAIDLEHDRLEAKISKLPELDALADLEQRLAETRGAADAVAAEVDGIVREITRLEQEVQTIEDKIDREEKKLYGGEVINPKEVSALQSELEMLKRRKSPLEEEAIEQMDLREERTAERDRLRSEADGIDAEAEQVRRQIHDLTASIRQEIAAEVSKRNAILPAIPSETLELYEELRGTKKGIGAGALVNGACTACHETLPAMVVDRIKQKARAGEYEFRCEHCRRILVVA